MVTSPPDAAAMHPADDFLPIPVAVPGGRSYRLLFSPLSEVGTLMAEADLSRGRCLVVTDETVAALYLEPLERALDAAGWEARAIIVPPGERSKSADQLQTIYDGALGWGVERRTPLLALGGGVVGDLAGFAAATLLRGLPFVQLPTSLIAQVDSAVGGKTGINHAAGKNLIGAFHQPALVCIDTGVLASLPVREWTSGLAEVVKHALIADADLLQALESDWERLEERDVGVAAPIVYRAAGIKAAVVSQDEREAGIRAILNFGHTFGHAVERAAGYGTFTHGEAVALGMRAALHLSHQLHPELPVERADQLVARIPVPSGLSRLPIDGLMDAMQQDKKVQAGALRFVVLDRLGHARVTSDVSEKMVEEAWLHARHLAP